MGIGCKKIELANKLIYKHLIPKIPPFSYYMVSAFTSHFRKGQVLSAHFQNHHKTRNPAFWHCGITQNIITTSISSVTPTVSHYSERAVSLHSRTR